MCLNCPQLRETYFDDCSNLIPVDIKVWMEIVLAAKLERPKPPYYGRCLEGEKFLAPAGMEKYYRVQIRYFYNRDWSIGTRPYVQKFRVTIFYASEIGDIYRLPETQFLHLRHYLPRTVFNCLPGIETYRTAFYKTNAVYTYRMKKKLG